MTDIQTFRSVVSEMIKRSPSIVIVSKITIAYRNGITCQSKLLSLVIIQQPTKKLIIPTRIKKTKLHKIAKQDMILLTPKKKKKVEVQNKVE